MKRDFFVIGHACNNLRILKKAIRQGVNGIECDLWFDENGWSISHDGFKKYDLEKWLSYFSRAHSKSGKVVLVIFDFKKAVNATGVRRLINSILPARIRRIYSIAKIKDAGIFSGFSRDLSGNEGIAIDEESDPEIVANYFSENEIRNGWYGNGITSLPINGYIHDSMKRAAEFRDSGRVFSKIFSWTVTRKNEIKKYILEDGVDGLLVATNNLFYKPVRNAIKIIHSSPNHRLADENSDFF